MERNQEHCSTTESVTGAEVVGHLPGVPYVLAITGVMALPLWEHFMHHICHR